ncbi:MAG TPA: TolC family protein [Thermodesulfobacteriota bacterium]|nr:TolC family protein [Thermodesulfobacteriota bacterium]
MKKVLILSCILSIMFISFSRVQAQEEVKRLELKQLIEDALNNNPELTAHQEGLKVYGERPAQEGALEDPRLTIGVMSLPVDTFDFNQEDMTTKQVELMQRLPFPGKLGLKKEMATKEYLAASQGVEEKKLEIIKKVKTLYFDFYCVNKALEITEKNRGLLSTLTKITETKYSVGEGIQQDVLKAQVELSKVSEESITLKQQKETIKAELNSLLNRLPQSPLPDPPEIEITPASLSLEKLQEIALDKSPRLKRLAQMIEKNKVAYSLAKKEYYPDFDVAVSYGQRNDSRLVDRADMVSASVSIPLPLWYKNKQDKKVEETHCSVNVAQAEHVAAKNEIFYRIKDLTAKEEKQKALLDLYRTGIIPQARQSLDSAIAGYRVNKVDFLTLLDNRMTLYNYEVFYHQTVADYEKNLAELEEVTGETFF